MVKASVNTIRYMIQELRQMIDSLERDLPETTINETLTPFTHFFDEKIVTLKLDMAEDSTSGLKLDDAYFSFLEWYKHNCGGGSKTPNRKELRRMMEFKYGKPKPGNRWPGLKLKEEDCHDTLD